MSVVTLALVVWLSAGNQHRNVLSPEVSCIPTALAAFERTHGMPTLPDSVTLEGVGAAGTVSVRTLSALRGWTSVDVSTSPEGCRPCLAVLNHDWPGLHAVLLEVDGDHWRTWDPWGTPSWGGFGRLEYSDLEGGRWHDFPASDRWRLDQALILKRKQ